MPPENEEKKDDEDEEELSPGVNPRTQWDEESAMSLDYEPPAPEPEEESEE